MSIAQQILALDGEMTGADITRGHRLIQVGAAFHSSPAGDELPGLDAFSMLVNPGEHVWDLGAEGIHGITPDEVAAAAPAEEVDELFYEWLIAHGAEAGRRSLIPVGFNIANFDVPHFQAVLPKSAALFSHRSIDLNAVIYTLDGAAGPGSSGPLSDAEWKRFAKGHAQAEIERLCAANPDIEIHAHDAGYDALLHLHVWRYLRAATHGAPLPVTLREEQAPATQVWAQALLDIHGAAQASALTAIPAEFLQGWAKGGRATRTDWIDALESAYLASPPQ